MKLSDDQMDVSCLSMLAIVSSIPKASSKYIPRNVFTLFTVYRPFANIPRSMHNTLRKLLLDLQEKETS
jgi:hypothetical protein